MSTALLSQQPATVWKVPLKQWLVAALACAALLATFHSGLRFMVATWNQVEEYSYGYFIPLISVFLIWQKSEQLRARELRGSWSGLALVAIALLMWAVGEFSAVRLFSQYGFVVAVFGLSACFIGWPGTRV